MTRPLDPRPQSVHAPAAVAGCPDAGPALKECQAPFGTADVSGPRSLGAGLLGQAFNGGELWVVGVVFPDRR
jgi:hypothetical protein